MNFYLLVIVLLGAYLLQFAFSFIQLKSFQKNYNEMAQYGRVVVGKKKGYIRAGTIIIFAIDEKNRVLEAAQMQGVTCFSGFKKIPLMKGIVLDEENMNDEHIKAFNGLTQKAILSAKNSLLPKIEVEKKTRLSRFRSFSL